MTKGDIIAVILALLFVLSVIAALLSPIMLIDPKPRECYKYTIFQGSAAVAVGYGTNSLTEENGAYIVGNKMLPKSGTYMIEKNNCEED